MGIFNSKIVICGAGNVAHSLGYLLHEKGGRVLQVCNRSNEPGKILADRLGADFIHHPAEIDNEADFVFLCVSDQAISDVAEQLNHHLSSCIVHLSGSVSINALEKLPNRGVLYPLQSFSLGRKVQWKNLPIYVEWSNDYTREKLLGFARSISGNVMEMDSVQRQKLHLAAVISSNFVNYMLTCADEYCQAESISFNDLKALVLETVQKAFELGPAEAQTGPARRNDHLVIKKHQELLHAYPGIESVYTAISKMIKERYPETINRHGEG